MLGGGEHCDQAVQSSTAHGASGALNNADGVISRVYLQVVFTLNNALNAALMIQIGAINIYKDR